MSIASRIARLVAAQPLPATACADCPPMAVVYEDRPDQVQPQPTCATCGRPVANVVTFCYADGDAWRRAQ